jgi:hypothetical protein
MPEPQPIPQVPASPMFGSADAAPPWMSESDVALGFECADPSLQIEAWHAEGAPGRAAEAN